MSRAALASCLYDGIVSHRRLAPVARRFRYRVRMCCLDLAELPDAFRVSRLASMDAPSPLRFRREDHLGDPRVPLAECVRDLVESATGRRPAGPIRLLTNLRHFGYVFNPLSVHYCLADDGATVEAVVAEVSNTPWGERHCYVLEPRDDGDGVLVARNAKEFHVSPFLPMDLEYAWRLTAPADALGLEITCRRGGEPVFAASLALARRPWTRREIRLWLLRHPLMTQKVFAAIHWQALRVFLARVPVHEHPGGPVRREAREPAAPRGRERP